MRVPRTARTNARKRELDIPKTRFDGLVREVLGSMKECKIQAAAVSILHKTSEAYLTELFADANMIRRTSGRSEMHVRHLQCASSLDLARLRRAACNAHLRRIGVDDAQVRVPLGPVQRDFLHVHALDPVRLHVQLGVDHLQELVNVSQQLLRDALASTVDRHLDVGCAENHCGRKHRHADGLPEAPGRRDQDLLGQMRPPVLLQNLLVAPRELPVLLGLPEHPSTGAQELVMELAL
eukprot:3939888-Rhodomonas_salina.1